MAHESKGWIDTATGELPEYPRNIDKKPSKKIEHLPPVTIHYDHFGPSITKEWTDHTLLTYENVNNYLAETNAFQRASFTDMVERWKEYKRNETVQLMSSFDSQYNMKRRFRDDDQLNRLSEVKHTTIAKYYRFIGNENNPKNTRPCGIHQRHTQKYDERHIRESIKLPSLTKARSVPYFLPNRTKLPFIQSAPVATAFEFDNESCHTYS